MALDKTEKRLAKDPISRKQVQDVHKSNSPRFDDRVYKYGFFPLWLPHGIRTVTVLKGLKIFHVLRWKAVSTMVLAGTCISRIFGKIFDH